MRHNERQELGLYLSVPFCRSKCTYCNFASGVYPASEHARYIERVIDDLRAARNFASGNQLHLPRVVDSIYLGGGTPTLLTAEHFTRLFAAIRDTFTLTEGAEITVECAPGQISDGTLAAMAACGVNRASLGVQSFVDTEAAQAGRLHTRRVIFEDLARLRAAGIRNLNVDLIAGLAGQTTTSWLESLHVLGEATPTHASIYMLEVDEESRLGRELLGGGTRYRAGLVPNEESIITMYECGIEYLSGAGLEQYEISNFSRPGFESRHNLRYWQRRPYLGLGLDASSFLYAAETNEKVTAMRWCETSELGEYLQQSVGRELKELDRCAELEEEFFLGLRMNRGVSVERLKVVYGDSAVAALVPDVKPMIADGLLCEENNLLKLTARGRLLSNEVFAEFLSPAIE